MKFSLLLFSLALSVVANSAEILKSAGIPKAGADQKTPSRAQYFSWINNTNEGTTEGQTRANLSFFQWLHDEYGMTLDIYAFDAGFVDGKLFSSILVESDRFKQPFPNGLGGVVNAAAKMGTRLGHWGGPDGFGDTAAQEKARIDMMVGHCRDYNWARYQFDAVCGELRPEKEAAFIPMMKESRVHSPDLIALNGKLGIEGGHPARCTSAGHSIGASDRATSFPCNPWEGATCKRDSNYTYYFSIRPEMIGKDLEVVVFVGADSNDQLLPEVWQTAHAVPSSE